MSIRMSLPLTELQKFLASIQPFNALSPEDLKQIIHKTMEKTFSKGEAIFNEGEEADSVWILYKGRIQIFKYTSDGKSFAVESLAVGELFGTLCRLGGNDRNYPCSAIVSETTVVLRIPDSVFLEYYMKSPGLVRGLCTLCSDRLKDVQNLRCMGQETVPVRIASILHRLHQVHGETIPFTKREISELVGTTIETTFRTLSEFQKKGYLTSLRGKILIEKPNGLKSFADRM